MRIVVLLKQVPDTWDERRLDPGTGRVDRGNPVADEIGERALDLALRLRDAAGGELVAMTMGPPRARDVLRAALAVGADSAVHVVDDALAGADVVATATALAEAITPLSADLVLAGNESTDGRGGVVPSMLAELLGLPLLGSVDDLDLHGDRARGTRVTDSATTTVEAALPAVASITERAGEPRFPSFRGVIAAKKKPIAEIAPAPGARRSHVVDVSGRAAQTAGLRVVDDGTAAAQLVEFLIRERAL